MTDTQTRQQRRAAERRAKKQGTPQQESATMTHDAPEIDVFNLPMLNAANIETFRQSHGIVTHADLHTLIDTRNALAEAFNRLIDLPPACREFSQPSVDEMDALIETMDELITPTEEALCDYFVDEWAHVVIDGEHRVRYDRDEAERLWGIAS